MRRYTAPDGVFPCAHPNGDCSAPQEWYPEFSYALGPPLGPYSVDGVVYTRRFQSAVVTFNAGNVTASTIQWASTA